MPRHFRPLKAAHLSTIARRSRSHYILRRDNNPFFTMASMDISSSLQQPAESSTLPARKKLKTSDLPLKSDQRASIDNLLNTIKRNGEFDVLRKKVWAQFVESVRATLLSTCYQSSHRTLERKCWVQCILDRNRGSRN